MTKTFTWTEAQTLLPVLEALLRRARVSASLASQLENDAQALNHRIFFSGGLRVDVVAAARRNAEREKAVRETNDSLGEIDAIGVEVTDLDEGVLAFPCKLEGEVVRLSWQLGETSITAWYGEGEGLSERRPVDERFGRVDRDRLN